MKRLLGGKYVEAELEAIKNFKIKSVRQMKK
jgi:hypothetical protein